MTRALTLAAVLVATLAMATAPKKITIFVGPQTRDGYVDVDKGVKDSIQDLKKQLRDKRTLAVVEQKDAAQIVLEVLGRGATSKTQGGTAALPIGASTFYIPFGTIGITTVMHVGSYDKPIVFDNCGDWTHCARLVARDVETWVAANADRLTP